MGLFEEQPWLMVPFVLVVVIAYDGVKWTVRRLLANSSSTPVEGEARGGGSH